MGHLGLRKGRIGLVTVYRTLRLLRECGRTNPRRLATYLMAHGPRVPRTTLRYAIERFPKAQRDELMERTRPAGTPA